MRSQGMCAMQEPDVSQARTDGNNETQIDKYASFRFIALFLKPHSNQGMSTLTSTTLDSNPPTPQKKLFCLAKAYS